MKQSLIYPFVLNMWIARKVDEDFVEGQFILGRLTADEATDILNTPQK